MVILTHPNLSHGAAGLLAARIEPAVPHSCPHFINTEIGPRFLLQREIAGKIRSVAILLG